MKTIALVFIFASALLFACDSQKKGQAHSGEDNHAAHNDAPGDSHRTESEKTDAHTHDMDPIQLNGDQKWDVNKEMMPHIEAGENVFSTYQSNSGTDFKSLATDLRNHNNKLISSCTMQGESHDQLHNWLVPHIALISDLEKAESEEMAKPVVEKLQTSFATFHNYFQ